MDEVNRTNFDQVVPIYDFFKTLLFLGSIQRCQYFHLSLLKDCKNILVIGGGTGRIIGVIHEHCAFDSMLYIDSSAQMMDRAKRFIQDTQSELEEIIEFQTSDILDFPLNRKFDAVIMPFIADCFSNAQLVKLGEKLSKTLSPGGILLLSDFYESPHSAFSNSLSRCVTRPLYFVLGKLCDLGIHQLPDFNHLIQSMELKEKEESTFSGGVLRSIVYERACEKTR